jgi:arginine/lysine/ornithine decarboxylase
MARNCHKSAYHAALLQDIAVDYIYPDIISDYNIQGGISPEEVARKLASNPNIQAVIIVSPTYDGVASDIRSIANIAHEYNIPLIVDEAHGAHFSFAQSSDFPDSSLSLGADVVIQSIHKTLPSLTQTAVIHMRRGFADPDSINRYLRIYQSSSPSYILLSSIENCILHMADNGHTDMHEFKKRLQDVRGRLVSLQNLSLIDPEIGTHSVYAYDHSKILISTRNTNISGAQLESILRSKYHLEMEMYTADYVSAITTLYDTDEGFVRLVSALHEIDATLSYVEPSKDSQPLDNATYSPLTQAMTISEAVNSTASQCGIPQSSGCVSTEFVYIYPPGVPIIVPGEIISPEVIKLIEHYIELNLPLQGMADTKRQYILVT